ncbi:MAG: DUF6263 family protein [Ginsengibacter sp.]
MKKIALLFSTAIGFTTVTMAQSTGILNLNKGQKFVVENKISTTSSTQMQGQSMDTKADIASVYSIEVKNKTDNSFDLTNTITNIKMNMTMMGNNINFDSDSTKDMDGQIGSSLKDYINQPKDVEIDKSGNVITKASADTSESAIAKQLGFDASGYGAQVAFLAMPQNLKAGTTWSDKIDNDGISKSTSYVINDISGGVATVSFTGTATTNKTFQQQGMEISTKTTGKFSGEEKVDTKTGVVQTNTSTTEASGTVTAMGQDFPTTTKITSTTSVKTL